MDEFIRECRELIEGLTKKIDELEELNRRLKEEIHKGDNKDNW